MVIRGKIDYIYHYIKLVIAVTIVMVNGYGNFIRAASYYLISKIEYM